MLFAGLLDAAVHWCGLAVVAAVAVWVVSALVKAALWRGEYSAVDSATGERRRVLVTGCDTGFGQAVALSLHTAGFRVYAACLTDAGMQQFTKLQSKNLTALRMDITNEEQVAAGVKLIETEDDKLWAVINNAGIALGYLVEWTSVAMYQRVMDVNFFGHIRVIKACLPMLYNGRGRVINVTSVAGFIASAGMSAYCASKFAFEAFSDSLRVEMQSWGVAVTMIEPGFFNTAIVANAPRMIQSAFEALPSNIKSRYGDAWLQKSMQLAETVHASSGNPESVVRQMHQCVTTRYLEARYRVGLDAHLLWLPLTYLPSIVRDFILRFPVQRAARARTLALAKKQQ